MSLGGCADLEYMPDLSADHRCNKNKRTNNTVINKTSNEPYISNLIVYVQPRCKVIPLYFSRAISVARLTQEPEVPSSIPGPVTYFVSPSTDPTRAERNGAQFITG